MLGMNDSSSGELVDLLPIKRKGRCTRVNDAAGGLPHPPELPSRAACGPTCSSPALGSWGARAADCTGGSGLAAMEEDPDMRDTGESGRGKAQRVCSKDAPAASVCPCEATRGERAPHGAMPCPLNSQQLQIVSSLPPGLYRSFHLGCCSRLSSSSSLTELEANAAAAAASEAACSADACAAAAAAASAADAALHPAATALASISLQATCSCGACMLRFTNDAADPMQTDGWQGCAQQSVQPQQQQGAPLGATGEGSHWAEIPDDILKRVLERLPPSTLRVLRLVCRGWEAAASRLLRHLRPETLAGKQLARRFPALHSLDLSNAAMGVDFATPRMLRLQSLLRDADLAELAGLHRLEALSLRGCSRLSGLGLAQLSPLAASLTTLNLSNCGGLTDGCMAAMAAALPRLSTLNLQGCCQLGDAGIAHLAPLRGLRHILLPAGVTDTSMHTLAAMTALERVALRGCAHVTTAGVHTLLQRRAGLKRVVISRCPQVTLERLCAEPSFPTLKVVTEASLGASLAASVAAGAPVVGALAAPGLAGQDMHLLVADV